jgi:hypothetical protein
LSLLIAIKRRRRSLRFSPVACVAIDVLQLFNVQKGTVGPIRTRIGSLTGILLLLEGLDATAAAQGVRIATDGSRDPTLTVSIVSSNIVSQFSLPRATVGIAYSFTLTMFPAEPSVRTLNGVPNRINAWSASGLPPGLRIDFSGHVSGTPTAAGEYFPAFVRRVRTWVDFNKDFIPDCDLASVVANGECAASPATVLPMTESLIVDPFAITTAGTLPRGIAGARYPPVAMTASDCESHTGLFTTVWRWLFRRGPGCTWTARSDLPEGLSLTKRGVIGGTPRATFNGIVSIEVAHPSRGAVQKVFALAIASATPSPLTITGSGSPGPTPLGAIVAVLLTASGGTPPYSWSVVRDGAPPPGITLQGPGQPLGCVVVDQGSGLCTAEIPRLGPRDTIGASAGPGLTYLAGRALALGTYDFSVAVTDATGSIVTAPWMWVVTLP